ncbi:hypothetical protein [Amycolatopsis sp. NPDC098790]|uniref:hypothetical protein n=1 Tax=Amycolatopsis sp. NPDC098790 TaxID=3363939 RepID=UPI00381DC9EF
MDQNTLSEDPLGPPVLGQAAPVTARNQALTGHHARADGLGALSAWTTIGQAVES